MFWLKKLVGALLMPLPLGLLLMTIGAVCAVAQVRRTGRVLLLGGFLVLALASNQAIGNRLIADLEFRHPPMPGLGGNAAAPAALQACRYVVVLGGGHSDWTELAATARLSGSSLARIVEAVRLLRHLPEAELILFGGGREGRESHAELVRRAALELGVPAERIRLAPLVRDTAEEAAALPALVGDAPVALVTSAWHMPRAAAMVRRQGVNALPCPTDFAHRPPAGGGEAWWSFELAGLERTTLAWHEYLGLIWARLRGQI